MADLEAVELLTQAKERIMEHGWGQGPTTTRALAGDTESLCLEEALCGRRGAYVTDTQNPIIRRSAQYLQAAVIREHFLFVWNDKQRSANAVFDALDEAILRAKEAK